MLHYVLGMTAMTVLKACSTSFERVLQSNVLYWNDVLLLTSVSSPTHRCPSLPCLDAHYQADPAMEKTSWSSFRRRGLRQGSMACSLPEI